MAFPQSHRNADYSKITYNSFSKPERENGLLKISSTQTPTNVLTSNSSSSVGALKVRRRKEKNRRSAQAARIRKKAKMADLESQIQTLKKEIDIMQSENMKLRSQIQRMESSPPWKMRKQEHLTITPQLYDHRNNVPMSCTNGDNHGEFFPNSNEFPAYIHQGLQENNVDVHEANLVPFNQQYSDNGNFRAGNYTTPLWTSEAGSSIQRTNLTSYSVNANFNF